MGNVKIGWSEVNITPDKKVSLYGQFAERISEYVEKPLMATAMAVESCNDQMILIGCDLVEIQVFLVKAIREKLKDNKEGLDPEKIIISAIHTHTGPSYHVSTQNGGGDNFFKEMLEEIRPFMKPGQKYVQSADITNPEIATDQENCDMLVDRLSEAALEAWKNRKPASFKNGFDRAAVGMCRRVDYSDGTAQMWGESNTAVFTEMEGGSDSGVELLYTFDEAGKLTGAVVNVCCPAQCVQHRLFVSPDFWGETRKILKEKFGTGFFMLPTCSTAGDQCPVDLVRWVNPITDPHDPNLIRHNPPVRKADPSMFDLEGMKKAGRRVANAVLDGLESIEKDEAQSEIKFIHHVHNMQLPLRRATLTEKAAAQKALKEYIRSKDGDLTFMDVGNLQVHVGILQRFKLQEKENIMDSEVHVVRMGSVAFASFPMEVYLDYGNQIKARQLCEQSFLIQLANGCMEYLPTEKAEKHGHYSAFIGSSWVGHQGGDQLVRETLKDINGMFAGDYKVYEYKE